jgi:hypothetical protein
MTVLDIISREQLTQLREAGYVVVHRVPTKSMIKAASRGEYPENYGNDDAYHRMVAESIRLQNKEIATNGG